MDCISCIRNNVKEYKKYNDRLSKELELIIKELLKELNK